MTTQQSVSAYIHMKQSGKLNDEQEFVYEKLEKYGPKTGMELHKKLVTLEDNHASKIKGPERVRKRLPELVDAGIVEKTRVRPCKVTGREASEYQVIRTCR